MNERSTLMIRVLFVLMLAIGTYLTLQPITTAMSDSGRSFNSLFIDSTEQTEHTDILFVGDVMLARDVDAHMQKYGANYPFAIFDDLPNYKAVIGNFEAAIPKDHKMTVPPSTTLSVSSSVIPTLTSSGFSHFSLANNHSYDFKQEGFINTSSVLTDAGLTNFGHPSKVGTSSVTYIDLKDTTVAIIGLHTLYSELDFAHLDTLFLEVNKHSDLQVVYIHWGVEYEEEHSEEQERLAATLAQLGVDLILGHHPHVVQDIGRVGDVPVFYSLGNFIFDQYFSDEVEDGLMVTLSVADSTKPTVEIVPITSRASRARPQLLPPYERETFLRELASRSDPKLKEEIAAGRISLE